MSYQGNTQYGGGGNNPQVQGSISAGTGGTVNLGHQGYGGDNVNSGTQGYGGGSNVNSGNQVSGGGNINTGTQGYGEGNVNSGTEGSGGGADGFFECFKKLKSCFLRLMGFNQSSYIN
eukprot:TRINITY_DN7613_c3_g1_i1.p1 TRINITY_DN7613_c3_g1~~TRINITY_DN7613_c3_g1_i1.p1  ORF type:complete len:118 (+),score=9.45 TRINITY_DN7613_c3_g1_i1:248-601(+)